MKSILSFIACLTLSATAWSQQVVTEFNWKDLTPHGATPISLDGRAALKIENTNEAPLQLSLFTIAKPKITAQRYAVQGEVRYDAVQGDGFLEMWNYFPPVQPGLPEGEYFSRTMGESGEMGKISGTSDWRPFTLPFDSTGASGSPTKLQINLVLKGRGTVYIGPLKLVQYPVAKSTVGGGSEMDWFYGNTLHPWWSNRTSIWAGNLETVILMCLGFLIGVLCWKGKGRGFVIALLKIHICLGVLCGVAGAVAFAQHQPFSVWFPLSLSAFLLVAIYSGLLLTIGKCYQEQELRRMQALDASG
jgi:hypothetical protein